MTQNNSKRKAPLWEMSSCHPATHWGVFASIGGNTMTIEDTERNVVIWGKDRGLYDPPSAHMQLAKLLEEYQELLLAVLKDDRDGIIDGIGDMMVVMTALARMHDVDLGLCYDLAYNEIKDRTGAMIDGQFVKDAP